MNWYSEEDKLLRCYLLDDVTAEERRLVEDKLLSSDDINDLASEDEPDFADRLLLAEDELIDDYACGALSELQRRLFDANFLLNPERMQKIAIAEEIVAYAAADTELGDFLSAGGAWPDAVQGQPGIKSKRSDPGNEDSRFAESLKIEWWRKFFFPGWKIAVYATLALAVGFGTWRMFMDEPDLLKAKAEIRRVYSSERPLEARISDYEYARFPKSLGTSQDGFDYVALDRAERTLLDEVARHPTVEAQHELGRLYLARKKFDQAEKILESAIQIQPNNARLHNDLGAVLFEKWDRRRPTEQTGGQNAESEELKRRSIEYLTKALTLDASLHEARYNLALLYQASNQTQSAREEWNKYLRADPDSPWAKEAEFNLKMSK